MFFNDFPFNFGQNQSSNTTNLYISNWITFSGDIASTFIYYSIQYLLNVN